ncbi:hypothetical protein UlMin_003958 [Ulmus minor]
MWDSEILFTTMSSSSSLRLFAPRIRIPASLFHPKPLSLKLPNPYLFFRPISFQPIPTNPPSIPPSASSSSSVSLQPVEELPPKLQEIVRLFQSVPDPRAKYEQLLFYGKNLKTLDSHFKTRENKVEGCVSQVWVRAYLDQERNVVFEADSDSVLTKGLAALLVNGLSGRPVEEVVRVSPDFVVLLGLKQSLTASRNNGFLNMLKLMQKKALELFIEAEKGVESSNNVKGANFGSNPEVGIGEDSNFRSSSQERIEDSEQSRSAEDEIVSNSGDLGSRGKRIKEILEKELSPVELEVEDISYQHAGHAGVRGTDGETHFNVKVVSEEFEGKSLVKRHRLIYGLVQEEMETGLHALSIVAKAPSEVSGR